MKPVKKKVMNEMINYHELINFIEQKYKIDVRYYAALFGSAGKISHFKRYQNETGDKMPFDGHYPDSPNNKYRVYRNGRMITVSKRIYDADFKQIHDHYKRYEEWSKTNPEPPYLDYWNWLLKHCFYEVNNPSSQYMNIVEILEDEDTPSWVKEITQLIHDEFKDDLDSNGGLEVWVSW